MYLTAWFCYPCLRHIPITTFVLSTPPGPFGEQPTVTVIDNKNGEQVATFNYPDHDQLGRLAETNISGTFTYLKGALHLWPILWPFVYFSQKLQHIGDK